MSLDVYTSDNRGPTTSYESLESTETSHLPDVVAKPSREQRSIQPNIVRMVIDTGILVLNSVGGNSIQIVFRCMTMDLGTQRVVIGNKFA